MSIIHSPPVSEPLEYLLGLVKSQQQVQTLSVQGGGSGAGGSRSQSFNFGQQATGLAIGAPLSAPVTIPGGSSGLGGKAPSTPLSTGSRMTSLSVYNSRKPVNVAVQTNQVAVLAAALLGLGRLKSGRFLPDLGA